MKVLIFGKGKIGRAFFNLLSKRKFKVVFWEKNLDLKNYHFFWEPYQGK